jgi:hemolysin III
MNFLDPREPVNSWTHGAGLLLSLIGILLLWRRSGGVPAKRLSLLVYGLSLASCYAASVLYHGVRLPSEGIAVFDRLDRIGIYVLIAGSYTPLACNLMQGRWRWGTLATVWFLAAAATIQLSVWGRLPPVLSSCLYLGMGWGVVLCYSELARVVSHRALLPLVAGGLCYSVGAVFNLLGWPVLWPGVFRSHELFHLFVMAGSLAHFWFMLKFVVPSHGPPSVGGSRSWPGIAGP